jgi:predicted amidohydrolase YtcJ
LLLHSSSSVAAWLASACRTTASVQGPAPDMVIVNARVYTVDTAFSTAEAVAITGGTLSAVGKTEDIRKLAGRSTKVIDAGGRTVIPGLMDNHLHNAGGGPGVDLSRARSMNDVLGAIAECVKTTDPGQVVVTNADWHEAQVKEQRLPYRKDLDTVPPKTPVVVVRGGHEYILNSAALKKWNITKATPQQGRRYRTARDRGDPTDDGLAQSAAARRFRGARALRTRVSARVSRTSPQACRANDHGSAR